MAKPRLRPLAQDIHNSLLMPSILIRGVEEQKAQAQELTDFFQAVSRYESTLSLEGFKGLAAEEELGVILSALPTDLISFMPHPENRNLGAKFEEDMATLIGNLYNQVDMATISAKDRREQRLTKPINIGGVQGTVSFRADALDGLEDNVVQDLLQRVGKNLTPDVNEATGELTGFHFFDKDGKVDITGRNLNANIAISESTYLTKILRLINSSTFSLKAYRDTRVKLGSTDPYRAIIGALNYLGGDIGTGIRMYYASQYNTTNTQPIIAHTFHLRFLYELTGAGITYQDNTIKPTVDFLVYNNIGSSGIQVLSTKAILQEAIQDQFGKTSSTIHYHIEDYSIPDIS